jgi:hypothetical protein
MSLFPPGRTLRPALSRAKRRVDPIRYSLPAGRGPGESPVHAGTTNNFRVACQADSKLCRYPRTHLRDPAERGYWRRGGRSAFRRARPPRRDTSEPRRLDRFATEYAPPPTRQIEGAPRFWRPSDRQPQDGGECREISQAGSLQADRPGPEAISPAGLN